MANVGTREEWRDAREALLIREKAATRMRDELRQARMDLPLVLVTEPYVFTGPSGDATLLELFEGRAQLTVQHFMFEREWEDGCPSCTYATDDLCTPAHLHDMDTSYALVSLAASAKLERWKAERGWDVPWYSSGGSTFNQDFGATVDDAEVPGYSCFYREGDDVFHTYSTFQRGTELLVSSTQQLDLTHLGRRM